MSTPLSSSDPELYSTILSQILTGYQLSVFHQNYARKCHSRKDLLQDDLSECKQIPKSLRNLLDVLSCVIISGPKQGRAAVAVSTGERGIAIYISHPTSSRSPIQVETHVQSLITTIKEIAHREDDDAQPRADLTQKMYEYSWDKFEHSFNKWRKEFDHVSAVIASGRDDVGLFFDVNEIDDLETVFENIRALGQMLSKNRIQEMASLITEYNLRWTMDHFVELQLAIYAGTSQAKKFTTGFGRLKLFDRVEQYANTYLKVYFPMTRWVTKWMSLDSYKSFLVRFAQARRLRPFIDAAYQVVVIPREIPRKVNATAEIDKEELKRMVREVLFHLEHDTNTDLGWINLEDPEYMDSFISWIQRKRRTTQIRPRSCHVHAELALLSYVRYHELNITPYLGISKLPCTLCRLVFQIHNTVMRPSVHCRSADVGLHEGTVWTLPSEMDGVILDDLMKRLKAMLVGVLLEYVNEKVGNPEGLWNMWGHGVYLLDKGYDN